MLELRNIVKQYDSINAVDDISLVVKSKNIFGLLGPNGAGKTTTIRMIMGIIEPDSGEIFLNNKNINKYGRGELGYLPEDRGLYQKQKLEETIKYFASLRGLGIKKASSQINYWLDRFNLLNQKNRKIEEFSKGNQQKIQFIISLIHDPSLIILDEPFTGLDPVNQVLLKEIIQEKSEEGKTIIFSTHQMEQVERLCDDICLINNGKIILNGKLNDIRKNYSSENIKLKYSGNIKSNQIKLYFENFELENSTISGKLNKPVRDFLNFINASVNIESFEIQVPTLEQIFIQTINKSN